MTDDRATADPDYYKKWRERNVDKERERERSATYYQLNKDDVKRKARKNWKKWYKANKDDYLAKQKAKRRAKRQESE